MNMLSRECAARGPFLWRSSWHALSPLPDNGGSKPFPVTIVNNGDRRYYRRRRRTIVTGLDQATVQIFGS